MDLMFNLDGLEKYHSSTQKARVLTERWVRNNMFCPRCGNPAIQQFQNNKPVADFFCPNCNNEYELKSKQDNLGKKINDGAYETMISRITSNNNPDFLFMGYSMDALSISNLVLIPKHFFTPNIIEKRKPLSQNARRAGWVGCNICISKIPKQGYIDIVKDGVVVNQEEVVNKTKRSTLLVTQDMQARGWILDILNCINKIPFTEFSLSEVYKFESELAIKHQNNHHIQPKIRQQLQILRDKGFIEFLQNGHYRKIL